MKLVIVSGLSGAGKTVALKQYEDLGYYCIDNLPLVMLGPISKLAIKSTDPRYERVAVGIDVRESAAEIARFPKYIERLRAHQIEARVLFLRAETNVLLNRYSETRRPHPLARDGLSLKDAVYSERQLLSPIANMADAIIDTTNKNLHQLREILQSQIPGGSAGQLTLQLESFGFRNGVPATADFVFDVRCLPNPHWEPSLRVLTGCDEPVAQWLSRQPLVRSMIDDIARYLERWLPQFLQQDRAYMTLAIGCTGGQHRSVYVVEQLALLLREQHELLNVRHRELHASTRLPNTAVEVTP